MTSHRPSLSPSLTPSSTETLTNTPANLPPSHCHQTLARFQSQFIWVAGFFGGDFAVWNTDLWVTQLAPKTNTSLCLSLHINSRPPVFTKCLFNENCIVSSLSDCLMAPVLLQVPGRGRDVWHKKAEPKTKTNNTCTPAHTYKHFTFQPHWVTSKSGSASN